MRGGAGLALLALFALGASASPGDWPSPPLYGLTPQLLGYAQLLSPPGYTSASVARGAASAAAAAGLSGTRLRAAVAVNFAPPLLGADNLLRFVSQSAPGYLAWLAAPPGTAVRVAASDLEGQLPWLLSFAASYAGANASVEYYAVSLPLGLVNASDSTFKLLWCLEVLGLDVALYGATVTPPRTAAPRFSVPYTFYAHQARSRGHASNCPHSFPIVSQLVARRATVRVRSLRATLWQFLAPFTADMWGALVALLSLQATTYFYYELNDSGVNLVKAEHARSATKAISYSTFLATMSVVGTNNHVPSSISGRAYQAIASFSIWIIMASYLANLASILGARPQPVQAVSGLGDFTRVSSPLCVRNNSIQLHFLATQYPSVRPLITGSTTVSMLDAVLRGDCAGGIEDELLLRWLLGDGDPSGEYCGIDTVGAPTPGAYPFALPVPLDPSRTPQPATLAALNVAIAAALYDGNYSVAEQSFLPRTRPLTQCSNYFAHQVVSDAAGIQPLSTRDMAGVFIMAAGAVVVTAAARPLRRQVFAARARLSRLSAAPQAATRRAAAAAGVGDEECDAVAAAVDAVATSLPLDDVARPVQQDSSQAELFVLRQELKARGTV